MYENSTFHRHFRKIIKIRTHCLRVNHKFLRAFDKLERDLFVIKYMRFYIFLFRRSPRSTCTFLKAAWVYLKPSTKKGSKILSQKKRTPHSVHATKNSDFFPSIVIIIFVKKYEYAKRWYTYKIKSRERHGEKNPSYRYHQTNWKISIFKINWKRRFELISFLWAPQRNFINVKCDEKFFTTLPSLISKFDFFAYMHSFQK